MGKCQTLSKALSHVTYFNRLERGICLATVLFGGKQTMISGSSRVGTWFPMETLAVALCSPAKGGISRSALAWEAVTPLQRCSVPRWHTLGRRKLWPWYNPSAVTLHVTRKSKMRQRCCRVLNTSVRRVFCARGACECVQAMLEGRPSAPPLPCAPWALPGPAFHWESVWCPSRRQAGYGAKRQQQTRRAWPLQILLSESLRFHNQ